MEGLGTTARLTRLNLGISLGLFVLLTGAWFLSSSQLALAQAADALTDTFVTLALLWAIRLAQKPPDANHPFGHHEAEPLAALLAAGVAITLAVEVIESAVYVLINGSSATLTNSVAAIFVLRVALRGIIATLATSHARGGFGAPSPALEALRVDARNDVGVALLALAGFFLARAGWPALDAWAALPLGLWVGFSGVALARGNVALLMGEAPSMERQEALLAVARSVEGVRAAQHLRARSQGTALFVWVEISIDPRLDIARAHDLGERVEAALEAEPDVAEAVAHVAPATIADPS